MELIKNEIFTQTDALQKTKELLSQHKDDLRQYLNQPFRNLIFLGCGSGHMLSDGAASMFSLYTDKKAVSLAGGEIMLNPERYKDIFTDSLVIVITRSGETSEVVFCLQAMKKLTAFKTLGIIAKENCTLNSMVDVSLEIPWAFDKSVCQTRNVSNFYYALTMLLAIYRDDADLENCFSSFISSQPDYIDRMKEKCKEIAMRDWDNVTVLADGEVCGIAGEGGLAFTEISMLPGEYFHLLDYRHGPIVLADSKKLVIALLNSAKEEAYQKQMVADLRKRGTTVITLGLKDQDFWDSDYHVSLDFISRYEVWGLALINVCQLLAFYKALACGHDPDSPDGLDPYIKL